MTLPPVDSPEGRNDSAREKGDFDANIAALFAQQAALTPDAVAIIDLETTTTYGALMQRVDQIGAHLVQRGLPAEQPVGVLMRRSAELVAVLLGVLKAGGAYVPLDPDEPALRLRSMVDGAGCALVLGDAPLLEALRGTMESPPNRGRAVEFVDVTRIERDAPAGTAPASAPGGARLAYILFTSGSTGAPKGVEVEHRSVVNLLFAARNLFEFTESDRYLATATIGFDISVAELFLPLVTGGSMLLRDRNLLLDPQRLADELKRHNVTVFQTGPSVWSVALSQIPDFPKVRVAISTGEAIAPELAKQVAARGEQSWNLYGPTEATVWATAHRQDGPAPSADVNSTVSAPIGRALDGLDCLVLGEHDEPLGPGEQGELCIGGIGVARGYRGNDALTQRRFVTLGPERRRYYRTGDLVARGADGVLHYFGRNDDQIKIRGVRIEPMEVEAAILRHPRVLHAAATWFTTPAGSRSIVAAIVLKPGVTATAEQLRAGLDRLLPPQMIPSRFTFHDRLPQSPSGKVDRNAIRAAVAALDVAAPAGDPRTLTETERALAGIWQRTLNLQNVAADDHFFSIGGDSLAAVKMMLEVEAGFDVSLTVQIVFEAPTLERLAARIDRARAQPDDLANSQFIFPLAPDGEGTPVFFASVDLKLARKGMWSVGCPLYSISQWAQGSGFAQADTLEALARVHIDGIRAVQPHGPYRLAGYSFGGLIALEIAQQLRAAGESIELLFLLDPMEPYRTERAPDTERRDVPAAAAIEPLQARISRHLGHLSRDPRQAAPYIGTRGLRILANTWAGALNAGRKSAAWQRLVYAIVHLHGRNPNPISHLLLPKNRWPAFWYTAQRLAKQYVTRRYEGPVLAVFLDEQERFQTWRALLGPEADVRIIATAHLGLFAEPAMSEWMNTLAERLEKSRLR